MIIDLELTTEMEKEFIRQLNKQLSGAASPITAIRSVRVEAVTHAAAEKVAA